jgi:hypothetical protein
VVKVGTSKAGSTISQLGCGTSVACHGKPIKEEEALVAKVTIGKCDKLVCLVHAAKAYRNSGSKDPLILNLSDKCW